MNECAPELHGPLLVIGVICVFITGFVIGMWCRTGKPDGDFDA